MKLSLWCVVFMLTMLYAPLAIGANEPSTPVENEEAGLVPRLPDVEEFRLIHADSMTLTRQKGKPQIFDGAVDIIMVDKEKNETQIRAEKITIYYEQDLKKIQKVQAEGRVRVHRLGTDATTELAIYRGDKNTIELLKDPHVKDARGELAANKITIYMDSNEVVAEGNVRGIVYPQALEKTDAK